MSATLRPLGPADLDALAALDHRLFSPPWPRANLERALAGDHWVLGALSGERLDGYLIGQVVAGEAELQQLGVAPEQRRQGLGAALLTAFCDQLRAAAVACVHLEVRASAEPARALYRRFGFTQVGCRRGYYPTAAGREDALLLRLEL